MAQVLEFKLPDLGEGLTEAEIVRWLVQVGDVVAIDQPVVEVDQHPLRTVGRVVEVDLVRPVLVTGGAALEVVLQRRASAFLIHACHSSDRHAPVGVLLGGP